jgi:hypothetical protein
MSAAELRSAPPLPDSLPLTVLSAETSKGLVPPKLSFLVGDVSSTRLAGHRALAARSTRGTWRIVPGSDHLIAGSQPQAVIAAVREMIAELGAVAR